MADSLDPITNTADLIDSRDVIARVDYLRQEWSAATGEDWDTFALSEDDWSVGIGEEAAELVALLALVAEAADYAADWYHGETLIRDSYFQDYARELAEDCGMLDDAARWPHSCIDWERAARELRMDYSAVDFDGVTYWVR